MARHGVIWIALGRRIAQIRSNARASREVLLTSIRPGVVRACDRLTGGMFVAFGVGLAARRSTPRVHHGLEVFALTVAVLLVTTAAIQTARDVLEQFLRTVTLNELLRGQLGHVAATTTP